MATTKKATQRAPKRSTRKADQQVRDEVYTWQSLATSYVNHDMTQPHARAIDRLLENPPEDIQEELELWRGLARKVLAKHPEKGYCGMGEIYVRQARVLLGEDVRLWGSVRVNIDNIPVGKDGNLISDLRVTITTTNGEVLAKNVQPTSVTRNLS